MGIWRLPILDKKMSYDKVYTDINTALRTYENDLDNIKSAPPYMRESLSINAYNKLYETLQRIVHEEQTS